MDDDGPRGAAELHAAQDGPHAAAQLGDPDRLGHVVVGAGLEREHRVGLAVAGGDGDHVGRLAGAAQAPAHLDAVGTRPEADVEEHEVEGLRRQRVQGGAAVGRLDHVVAVARQRAGHDLPQIDVVLHHEHATAESAVAVVAEHRAQCRAANAPASHSTT